MDLKQLEIFNKIASLGSFSRAADELFLSQSTISSHIKNLETEYGIDLFNRNKSKVELTPAGTILFEYSKRLLALKSETEKTLANYKDGLTGSLTLVTSHTICNWILPEILKKFIKKYPNIEIILNTEFSPSTIEMIIRRSAQFGIIRTPTPKFLDDRLVSKILGSDETAFFACPAHSLTHLKTVTLKRVSQEPIIVYGRSTSYWPQIVSIFNNAGLQPKTNMDLNDIQAVKLMVKLGMGIAYLPIISAKDDINNGSLVKIDIVDCPIIKRYSHLIYRQDLIKSGPIEKFIDFLNSLPMRNL